MSAGLARNPDGSETTWQRQSRSAPTDIPVGIRSMCCSDAYGWGSSSLGLAFPRLTPWKGMAVATTFTLLPAPLTQRHTHADLPEWSTTHVSSDDLPRVGRQQAWTTLRGSQSEGPPFLMRGRLAGAFFDDGRPGRRRSSCATSAAATATSAPSRAISPRRTTSLRLTRCPA